MIDENYNRIPALILAQNPRFARSEAYAVLVDSGVEDLPGVVLGCFGKFLVTGLDDPEVAKSGFPTLEALVEMGDKDVREAVVNEVFEVRAEPVSVLARFFAKLGPRCQVLYRETCRPIPGL